MQAFERALEFATHNHELVGQERKYTGEPYIVHPIEVSDIVASMPHTLAQKIAGVLHDTVEDTRATLELIESLFGAEVAELVENVTDVSKPSDGNRKVRKEIDRQHLAKAKPAAKTIKLADVISNGREILKHDRTFAKVYLPEMDALLDVLKEGDPTLWAEARRIVDAGLQELAA